MLFLKKHSVIIIFFIFFILLLLQNQSLYLYHDDYGYASLSYAYNVESVIGTQYNLIQIVEFLIGHYNIWGGRILCFFIEICLLKSGIITFRIVQSLIITGIFFLIYLIAKKNIKLSLKNWQLALLSISLYGAFEIMIVRSGILWITASVLYIFPLLFFLLFVYLYDKEIIQKYNKKIIKTLLYVICGISVFVASFSQEQIAAATLLYIIITMIYNYVKTKKANKIDIIMLIISLIGFGILVLAPGNELRKMHHTSIEFYAMPFIERTLKAIPNIIICNFGQYTKLFSIIFYSTVFYCSYRLIIEKKGLKIISSMSFISIFFVILFSVFQNGFYFEYLYSFASNIYLKAIIVSLFLIQLLLIIYSLTLFLYHKKEYDIIKLLFCGIVSQIVMLLAPYFPMRSVIMFEIICFVIIVNVFQYMCLEIKEKKIGVYILFCISFILLLNYINISKGYYINKAINKYNHSILEKTSKNIANNENIEVIYLKKLPDILYSGDQPYYEGNEYILEWIREYYNIPKNISIIYQ
jgi:hypothetical protein